MCDIDLVLNKRTAGLASHETLGFSPSNSFQRFGSFGKNKVLIALFPSSTGPMIAFWVLFRNDALSSGGKAGFADPENSLRKKEKREVDSSRAVSPPPPPGQPVQLGASQFSRKLQRGQYFWSPDYLPNLTPLLCLYFARASVWERSSLFLASNP